jgi:hypothetical protein
VSEGHPEEEVQLRAETPAVLAGVGRAVETVEEIPVEAAAEAEAGTVIGNS